MLRSIPGVAREKAALYNRVFDETLVEADLEAYWASGRVNLLGEHTDYNDGFVLPVAVQLVFAVVGRAIEKPCVRLWSEQNQALVEIDLATLPQSFVEQKKQLPSWAYYALGVLTELREIGLPLVGFQALLMSNVPNGGGMSSSAAYEVALTRAAGGFARLQDHVFFQDPLQMALLCQKAEQAATGLRCGILDQAAICLTQADHALFLDCRSLAYRFVRMALPENVIMLVVDSGVRRELASSAYNERRQQCEQAVALFQGTANEEGVHIEALRDVSSLQFQRWQALLSPLLRKRAGYVIAENERVLRAVDLLEQGDAEELGRLMWETHRGLRDDYEVSCPEIELLIDVAQAMPGVLGARLMGGGFGGCILSLIKREAVRPFRDAIVQHYPPVTGIMPRFHACRALKETEYFSF